MWNCAPHLGLARAAIVSNIWLLQDSLGRNYLIDSGFALERKALDISLWRSGIRNTGDLEAILLTHRHSDHAGNAAWLREKFDCPVLCHKNDAPYLDGRLKHVPLKYGVGNLFDDACSYYENNHHVQMKIDEVFESHELTHGFRVIPVFGHTEGSSMLYHEETKTLFSGDAILSGPPPLRIVERFSLAIEAYCCDAQACWQATLDFLVDHPPIVYLCTGHGPFVGIETSEKLVEVYMKSRKESSLLAI